jgi:hypothetical protein
MPDEISADRVTAIATAARVPLAPIDAERIARAVAPTAARFAAAKIDLSLETEPQVLPPCSSGRSGGEGSCRVDAYRGRGRPPPPHILLHRADAMDA